MGNKKRTRTLEQLEQATEVAALTNVEKMLKLTKLIDTNIFYGAMLISKLEEMSESAVNYPDSIRKRMDETGSSKAISPDLVIKFWREVYEIVKFSE